MKHPLPEGCVCDPLDEEWIGGPRRAVCTTPIFTVHTDLEPSKHDICGRCEHDRACHTKLLAEKESASQRESSKAMLTSSELLATTFSNFNQIFGVTK